MKKKPYSNINITEDDNISRPQNLDIVSIVPIGLNTMLDIAELSLLIKTYHGGKYVLKSRYELEHTKQESDYLLTNILASGNGLLGKRTIEVLTDDIEVLYTNFDMRRKEDYIILFCDKFNLTMPEKFMYPLAYLDWSISMDLIDTGTLFNILMSIDTDDIDEEYGGLIEADHAYLEIYKDCILWTLNFYGSKPDIDIVKFLDKKKLKKLSKIYKGNDNVIDKRKEKLSMDKIDEYCFMCPEITYDYNPQNKCMGQIMRVYNSYNTWDIIRLSSMNVTPIW